MMTPLAIAISAKLDILTEGDSFTITETRFDGTRKDLAFITRADFEAVADGIPLEEILSCKGDMDWVAVRLSQRCAII